MKLLVTLFAVMLIGTSYSQTQTAQQTNVELFAQCLFTIPTEQEMLQLESDMRNIPFVSVVRLDWNTQRAFVITEGINTLSEADFASWFAQYEFTVGCIQIGVRGVDEMDSFPFTNCNN